MKKQTSANHIRFRRKPLITALEPRILLDGAAVATAAEMTTDVAYQDDAVHTAAAEQSVHFAAPAASGSEPGNRREVAVVDTSVENYQQLVDGLGEGVEVMLIDGSDNGLEQMVAALQGQTGIDALHLFSHGDVGELKLGTLTLNGDNLDANAELLSTLGESLSESGDLMLYGCYVGANSEGLSFIDSVADLTRADVAASEDLTGATDKGGDWDLEAESGQIEADALAVAGFDGVLAPTVTALADSVTYTEGGAPVLIDTGISFSGGGDYREGYIRFTVDNATAGDNFVLQDAPNVNAVDAISTIGNDVYRGTGAGRERIGSIDAVENGRNGQPLKILLSTPLPNSGFEDGSADWTLSSEVYGDDPDEINFDNYNISLAKNSDSNSTYTGGTGTTNVQASSGFSPSASISSGLGVDGSNALYLQSSGSIQRGDQDPAASFQQDGYGSIHGPYATSSVITVENGDSISLDFRAVGSGDDYEVFGLLRRVDGSGNFISDNPNDSSNNVVLFAERGADTSGFVRVDKTGLSAGEYRFQFVGGTYDGSGGLVVGSNLYVDNIRLISSTPVSDALAGKIASQVAYSSTADDTRAERNITISAKDSAGAVGSDTVTLKVTQENNAPTWSNSTQLSFVAEDTTGHAGKTVAYMFDSVFDDVDTQFDPKDTLAGIIITADASNSTQGEWQYSTDGSSWYAVGSVSSDNGLLLSRDASLRFVPAADYNGSPGSLSTHAVDSSDGSISFTIGASRETYDTTQPGNTGGTSAVSAGASQVNTYIYAVNDAPVLDAPVGGTLVDTAVEDSFGALTGALSATDVDSGTLSYGIQGGTDDGTYVTLTGPYGTLQVSKSTGVYTFTPNAGAINGLSATETQAFTVTASDGSLTTTQTLAFTLEGANDTPVFEADNSTSQVSVFSKPNLNGTDSSPNQDNENANLASIVQWVINEGGDYTLDTGIQNFTDANLADKLAASGFFFMTDMEQFTSNFDPLSEADLPTSSANTINSWVNDGGVILMTGTYGLQDVQFLNRVFGWDLTSERGNSWNLNAANAAGTPFEGGPASLDNPSATDSIGAGNVDGFKAIYGTDRNATVAEIGFGAGRVLFLGYDFYDAGISGTGFTGSAPQYGADVIDGTYSNSDWVREIIPRALQYSAQLSADTQLAESGSTLSGDGQFSVSDVDQPDAVTVSVSGVIAEQRNSEGTPVSASSAQPSNAELLAMLDLGAQPAIDSSSTSGDVNWTFNSNGESFDYLAGGERLVLTYEITADDGNSGTATRTLTITINGVNDAPVAEAGNETTGENGVFNGNASATDVDGTITGFELISDVSSGSLTFNPNGSYSFDPGTAFDDLAVGETRQVTFSYKATDNTGADSEVTTVTLTITGSNDVPVVSADTGTTAENGTITASVPVATDVDGTIVGYQLVSDVASGNLSFNGDGSYTFVTGSDFDDLAVGETRQVSFTYTATDNDGGISAPGTVTFTITGTNDAPTIVAEAATAITEAEGDSSAQDLTDTGVVSFDDLDTTDVIDLSFASNGDIAWSGGTLDSGLAAALVAGFSIPATTDAAAPGNVNWTYNVADVNLDFLAAGETITFSYTVTATDNQGGTATDTLSFTITGSNDAPTVSVEAADGITEVVGDSSAQDLTDTGVVSFDDLDTTDVIDISFASNGDIAWSGGTLDSGLAAALVAGFSIPATTDAAAPGKVNWTYNVADVNLDFLAAGETITFSYTVTATDNQDAIATDVVTFTITGTNDAPVVNIAAPSEFVEAGEAGNQPLEQTGTVDFADADLNNTINIGFVSNNDISWKRDNDTIVAELPEALASSLVNGFSVSGENLANAGQAEWQFSAEGLDLDFLNAGDSITFSYTVTVTDSEGATASEVVFVTLKGTNDAPEMTDRQLTDADTIVQQSADFTLDVSSLFTDKDSAQSGEDLDFTITGLPRGLKYDPETGIISGKPTQPGPFTVTITATDASGATLSHTFGMTVTAVVADRSEPSPGGNSTVPAAPDTSAQSVDDSTADTGMPEGLVKETGSSDPADYSGFMSSRQGDVVILSEPGAVVIQSQNADGGTTLRASVDVNVDASGKVVFSEVQQEAFSTVSLAVASIDNTAPNQITIDIQDTSPTASAQQYSGSLASGESLPAWMQLDPATGSVVITNPPAGQKEVSIRIQAVGADGQVRVLELKLDIEELLTQQGKAKPADTPADEPLTTGFVPLSEQLEGELVAREQYGDKLMALLQAV